HMDDTVWRVFGPDLPAGTRVEVIGVEGTALRVQPLARNSPSSGGDTSCHHDHDVGGGDSGGD
ncbi:MAG: hypothetical protein P3W87_005090, partial [Gammaproteobacteria bacterium]|nr:hypothetical protein [Gammaproteobacteria bacterium]